MQLFRVSAMVLAPLYVGMQIETNISGPPFLLGRCGVDPNC